MWLAHRLGRVLACRFLTRNLLRILGLCFLGVEGVRDTGRRFRLTHVLDCLAHLVGMFTFTTVGTRPRLVLLDTEFIVGLWRWLGPTS